VPIYEFRCTKCGKNFDVLRSREQAGAPAQCPDDGAAGQRLFTSSVVLTGGDFDGGSDDFDMDDMGGMGGMGGMGMDDFDDDF
jgi:putative FmdB family regulatory protein